MTLPLEHEVETAFAKHLSQSRYSWGDRYVHWVERQVDMPFEGRADIVATGERVNLVAEIKRARVRGEALAQLLGYMAQLSEVTRRRIDEGYNIPYRASNSIRGVLVGESFSKMVIRAATGLERISLYKYRVDENGRIHFDPIHDAWYLKEASTGRFIEACIENGLDQMIGHHEDMEMLYSGPLVNGDPDG